MKHIKHCLLSGLTAALVTYSPYITAQTTNMYPLLPADSVSVSELRENTLNSDGQTKAATATVFGEKGSSRTREKQAPRHTMAVNTGAGLITSKIETPTRKYKRKAMTQWQAEYNCIFKSGLGFGLKFFGSSTTISDDSFTEKIITPTFVARAKLAPKWIIKADLGLGYSSFNNSYEQQSGPVFSNSVGLEYMISKHIGIGGEFSSLICALKEPRHLQIGKDEWYGIRKIAFIGGLRYYL